MLRSMSLLHPLTLAAALGLAVVVASPSALACGDSGAHNRACTDAGWRFCSNHSDCAEGQHCDYDGQCACNAQRYRCPAETCDDAGCHCCAPVPVPEPRPDGAVDVPNLMDSSSGCPGPRYWCPATTADATVVFDASDTFEAGVRNGDGNKGCAVAPVGTGATPVVPAALVGLAVLAVLAGRRRE